MLKHKNEKEDEDEEEKNIYDFFGKWVLLSFLCLNYQKNYLLQMFICLYDILECHFDILVNSIQ
jgi:hypothetical protein